MPTIAEIRQQFPQYDDLSDADLLQGLHRKFYADVPFEDFEAAVQTSAQAPTEPRPTTWRERMFKTGAETLADPGATLPERMLAGATVGGRRALSAIAESVVTPGEIGSKISEVAAAPFAYIAEAAKGALEQAGVSREALERTERDIIGATPALMSPRPLRGRPAMRVAPEIVQPRLKAAMLEKPAEVRPLPGRGRPQAASTVPEQPVTIAHQLEAMLDGRKPAVLLTEEQARSPEVQAQIQRAIAVEGFGAVRTDRGIVVLDIDAASKLLESTPGETLSQKIRTVVAQGKEGELLGYGVAEKPRPGEPAILVETRGPGGEEVQTVVAPTPVPPEVVESAKRMVPPEGGEVAVTGPAGAGARAGEVIAERLGRTFGPGDPVEYRPRLSDQPVKGVVTHVNADGSVNVRAHAGGIVRKIPTEKLTPILQAEEVGLDSARIGRRVELGPDDAAVLTEMQERARATAGDVQGTKLFIDRSMETAEAAPSAIEVKGIKTAKPDWMQVPDKPGEYFGYDETLKVIQSLKRGKWPKGAKQERIAEQVLESIRFDAKEEKARLAADGAFARASESPAIPGREDAIRDAFFAEVDRLAAEEATVRAEPRPLPGRESRTAPAPPRPAPREPAGVTLGSLGGALQDAAHFLPESLRRLPERYRSFVDKGIQRLTARMPKVLREARGLGEEFVDLIHDRNAAIANAVERAVELGGELQHGLTPSERARVDQVLRGGITVNPAIQRIVEPTRQLITELQGKLLEYGYLTPEQVQEFSEKFHSAPEYLRRLYTSKLLQPERKEVFAVGRSGLVGRGVKSPIFLERGEHIEVRLPYSGGEPLVGKDRADFLRPYLEKGYRLLKTEGDRATLFRDLPESIRQQMGEIRGEPGFVAAKTIAEQGRVVANHEFLDAIRQNSEWAKPALTEAELASGEWTRLPGDKAKWGPLADHFVKKDVAKEVAESIALRQDWQKVIDRLVGMWKYGKVVVNPAAIGRNTISSAILADFGGLHPYNLDAYIVAAKELRAGSGHVAEAKRLGLFRSGFAQNEINALMDGMLASREQNGILRALDGMHALVEAGRKRTGFSPAELYGSVENFYRYALYRFGREELGLSPKDSRRYALKFAIDYEVVSPAVRTLRRLPVAGAPFATFSSKAIPLTLETLAKHPLRVLKYPALIYGVGKLAEQQIGQVPEETEAQRDLGSLNAIRYALLPVRDKDGRAQYLDLGYILPFGDLLELGDAITGESGRRAHISLLPVVSNPAFTMAEILTNRETFTGRDIAGPADTLPGRMQKYLNHLAKQWGPSLLPPLPGITTEGGYGFEDIRRAFAGETDWLGRTRSPVSAMTANLVGLRAKGVAAGELAHFRLRQVEKQLQALEAEAVKVASRLRGFPGQRETELARIRDRMREVATEAATLLAVVPRGTGAAPGRRAAAKGR